MPVRSCVRIVPPFSLLVTVAQIVMSRSTTSCFGMNEMRCFTVNVETHVASVKTDAGVWLCGSAVHHNFRLLDGVGGGQSLIVADFVEHDKYGGIDGA